MLLHARLMCAACLLMLGRDSDAFSAPSARQPQHRMASGTRWALVGVGMTASGGRAGAQSGPRGGRPSSPNSRGPPGASRPRSSGGARRRDPEPRVPAIQVDYLPPELSYVPEREMYTHYCAAAQASGHDEHTAAVLTRTTHRARAASGAAGLRRVRSG